MDTLYNQLLLRAVINKIKNNQSNRIQNYEIKGSWEPFAMLSEDDLNQIFQEFCHLTQNKLHELKIDISLLIKLKKVKNLMQIKREKQLQLRQKNKEDLITAYIRQRIKDHANKKAATIFEQVSNDDVSNLVSDKTYLTFNRNLTKLDKTISLMEKYTDSYLGLHNQEKILMSFKLFIIHLRRMKQKI